MQTITSTAQKLLDLFEEVEREDGKKIHKFKLSAIDERGDLYSQLNVIISQGGLHQDYSYKWIVEALEALQYGDIETAEELDDAVREFAESTDVYTSDLTEWLNASNAHVEYISEALQEFGTGDGTGFQLLSMAQYRARYEVAERVARLVTWLQKQ